ncbi:major capsid protein [Nocardia carnea]|uniref:major capsid protein n=1 Tax=Nocardia carnea TaxID=37328 RepID=UPI002456DAC9|nr:major capsid protein [Nocardia carnea]
MEFELPADLSALSLDELNDLLSKARTAFDAQAATIADDGATVSADTLAAMQTLNDAEEALTARIGEVQAEEAERADAARALVEARAARITEPEPDTEPDAPADTEPEPDATEVVAEAEQIVSDAAAPAVVASSKPAPSFRGLGAKRGNNVASVPPAPEVGFRMRRQIPKYQEGIVGYDAIAAALDNMATNSRIIPNRAPHRDNPGMVPLSIAELSRDFADDRIVTADSEIAFAEQVDAIIDATRYDKAQFADDGALVASGGWCSPSETIYTFCDVNPATGLLSLPDMNITRGGIRRPIEPDFSELYATLPFRYTETELEATNPDGTPVVIKPCIEIPCTTMEEIRMEAIGLCVTAGILQRRGWPELIARFMQEVTKAHLIKVSLWSILDMVAGSSSITVPSASQIAASSSLLNSLDVRATVIRQKEGLDKNAVIEGVAPTWVLGAARADMALQQGRDVKDITDAQIDSWLATRNIRMQWVGHWQPLPDASVVWPSSVQILLYPSGAWYRHLANVIEVGTLYDKAQLQANRYTELFTEDEYVVDNRCKVSEVVTVPLCATGAVGARDEIVCSTTTNEVQTVTITGTPTGGHFTLSFGGSTTSNLAHNATAATVQAALAALPTIGTGNIAVAGSAGGPYTVTFIGALGATNVAAMTATGSLTGGTTPAVAVALTTAGGPN